MSEFQYYEFRALDRPLTAQDKIYIQSLSSRVRPSRDQAIFTYSYGDFRGQPEDLLDRCFDIMLYMANFGVRRLMLRFPKGALDPKLFAPYCVDGCIAISTTKKSLILDLYLTCEDYYDWIEEENDWLDDLVTLRQEILAGDLRSLYLAWLQTAFAENTYGDIAKQIEPPIPPNLKPSSQYSPALSNFVNFFEIDADLIAVAATASSEIEDTQAPEPIADWIAALPETERNAYLLRVVESDTAIGRELLQHLRQCNGRIPEQPSGCAPGTRRLVDLIELGQQQAEAREREAKAAAKRERKRYLLQEIAPRAQALWQDIPQLVARKQARYYDEAVGYLLDLQALAQEQQELAAFTQRVQALRDRYPTLRGFHDRLKRAKLL
ncbi:MAG: hypothetical protein AAGG51_06780 [Cyanobacteria bacterium P01_G01_bin.54]